ncbi:uncharacterized protein [Eurosta solidaginis]|uniref:uncharacterized protein n=1 Tax=Eurosta solidaginis TaxID=178769 RepID=UPI0035310552
MTTFDKHLGRIANAISVDIDTSNYLQNDFGLIRIYLLDIIRNDPIFGPILVDSIKPASNFNCSLTFNFSRYMPLGAETTKYPAFITLGQRGRCKVNGMQDMPFFGNGIRITGGIITSVVRGIIAQGLDLSGYFVRGHMGDIYELELVDDSKSVEYNATRDYNSEWQTNYIMLDATTEGITFKIRLRVLLKFCSNEEPMDFMPYPTHRLKMVWLAAADVRYFEYFSLCAPLSERELAASPANLIALRLLILLLANNKVTHLKKNHLESISYELIYSKSQKKASSFNETVGVIITILQRVMLYLEKGVFPYYWNVKRNFLSCFRNGISEKMYIQSRVRNLLQQIHDMRRNEKISYEDVESFLGVQINSQIYNVDNFGIYRSFTHS